MSSREKIFHSVRKNTPEGEKPIPDLSELGMFFDSPIDQFIDSVPIVGGKCSRVNDLNELRAEVRKLSIVQDAKHICCLIPDLVDSSIDLEEYENAHDLESLDVTIAAGEFGVAENGAIWITDFGIKHRSCLFIPQHLILVIQSDQIINHMHQAYERIQFEPNRFGVFI